MSTECTVPRVSASRGEALLDDHSNVSEAEARHCDVSTFYGLSENVNEHFDFGKVLGQGGNALVVRAVSRHTGKEYACKCIRKVRLFFHPGRWCSHIELWEACA